MAISSDSTTSESTTRIVIVDDHPIIRRGLVQIIGNQPNIDVVGTGSSAHEAIELARTLTPDIMLLDLGMPGGGIAGLSQIREELPQIKCIILTVSDCSDTANRRRPARVF